jgi:hypothetical protein
MFFGKNKKLVDKKKALFMNKWECRDLGEVKEFYACESKDSVLILLSIKLIT